MTNVGINLSNLSEKQQRDYSIFRQLKKIAKKYKFRQLSEKALKNIYTHLGLVPPVAKRTEGLSKKISFVVEINRLVVYLHTTFNKETLEFTAGSLSVVVEDPFKKTAKKNKRVFFRQFNKIEGVAEKVEALIAFFIKEFNEENRPLTKNGDWATIKEKGQDNYVWADGSKTIRSLFRNAKASGLVWKVQKQRIYYEKTRTTKGVKRRRRKIKKKYKQKRS
ncbi:MAG TPA: hypothetical protein PLQ20_01035 [Candidatus Paceibacterota bacterium]|nr:hypothetical protein [Candidatus Paceibacterota bacterium]